MTCRYFNTPAHKWATIVAEDLQLSPSQTLVLGSLARHMNDRDFIAFLSYDTIQRETRLSRRKIPTALEALQERGLIQIIRDLKRGITDYKLVGYLATEDDPDDDTGPEQTELELDAPEEVVPHRSAPPRIVPVGSSTVELPVVHPCTQKGKGIKKRKGIEERGRGKREGARARANVPPPQKPHFLKKSKNSGSASAAPAAGVSGGDARSAMGPGHRDPERNASAAGVSGGDARSAMGPGHRDPERNASAAGVSGGDADPPDDSSHSSHDSHPSQTSSWHYGGLWGDERLADLLSPEQVQIIKAMAQLIEFHAECPNRGSHVRRRALAIRVMDLNEDCVAKAVAWIMKSEDPRAEKMARALAIWEDSVMPSPEAFDRIDQALRYLDARPKRDRNRRHVGY